MNTNRWTKENFKNYDAEHPEIYAMFEKFALQIAKKRAYYSAKSIFHRVRWETDIGDSDAQFKIDDGWISHYARKFIEQNPVYKELFQFRVRKGGYHDLQQSIET